jgi:hypothetical protein
MIDRRHLLAVCCVAIAGLATAGCADHLDVVTAASPNPFRMQGRFGVIAVDLSSLRIGEKSEAEYLAGKDPEQRASFEADKRAMNEEYTSGLVARAHELGYEIVLATGPESAPFLIRPSVRFIEPGFYAFVSVPSEVRMNVRVTAPDGRVLDEIQMTHHTQASAIINPSSGQRLRNDGRGLGIWTADYIAKLIGVSG